MKKLWIFFIFFQMLLFPACLFAQTAKIIDVKGKVLVKSELSYDWKKAKINMLLDKNAEVQTKEASKCTLAFDEGLKNILTVEEKSHIKIENVKPGSILLPEGRVFTLIGNLAKPEEFQIRTPTAIAGARGTCWAAGYNDRKTNVECFDDVVFVVGLDAAGNPTGEKDLSSGFGMDIGEPGMAGGAYVLGAGELNQGKDYMSYVARLIQRSTRNQEEQETGDMESLVEDRREGLEESSRENSRLDEERSQQSDEQQGDSIIDKALE